RAVPSGPAAHRPTIRARPFRAVPTRHPHHGRHPGGPAAPHRPVGPCRPHSPNPQGDPMTQPTTFTDAIATDLDPTELFELRTGLAVPRAAVLTIFAFLDMHGITHVQPASGGSFIEAADILTHLDAV